MIFIIVHYYEYSLIIFYDINLHYIYHLAAFVPGTYPDCTDRTDISYCSVSFYCGVLSIKTFIKQQTLPLI